MDASKPQQLSDALGPLIKEALGAHAEGRFLDAIQGYRSALKLDPKRTTLRVNLGMALWAANEERDAIQVLQEALAIDPQNASAWNSLGAIQRKSRRLDEAERCFRRAIEHGPGNPDAFFNLGQLLLETQRLEEAGEFFQVAAELAPLRAEPLFALAEIHGLLGRMPEALACTDRACLRASKAMWSHPDGGPAASRDKTITINLITTDNGVGLSRDINLIKTLLEARGFLIKYSNIHNNPIGKYDINIFLELLNPLWFCTSDINCLIPNPEWFFPRWLPFLSKINLVLAKTHFGQQVFSQFCNTSNTSFTSEDCRIQGVEMNARSFLHIAGKSTAKGTQALVKLWARHPEYPMLTVVQAPFLRQEFPALPNLTYLCEYLPLEELRLLQNSCGVHLCPSEAEGFGHYIVEALSVGALVITTDGPPMNELVQPDRGILCGVIKQSQSLLGLNSYFDPSDMERAVERVLSMTLNERRTLQGNARRFFELNDISFKAQFMTSIMGLIRGNERLCRRLRKSASEFET